MHQAMLLCSPIQIRPDKHVKTKFASQKIQNLGNSILIFNLFVDHYFSFAGPQKLFLSVNKNR